MTAATSSDAATPQRTPAATQRVVLFDTAAFYEPRASAWIAPVHAWVSNPTSSSARKAAIANLFRQRYGLDVTDASRPYFDERINLLLADNLGKVRPRIMVADTDYVMPATAANGHTRFEVVVKEDAPDDLLPFRITCPQAPEPAYAHRIKPEGHSVICDIDDTVKDTGVLDRARLWRSTFYEPFRAVPDMAALVTRLAGTDRAVHYISSSPWHLYQPLRQWLIADGFPVASLSLKHIRLKDRTILDILKSPEATKPPLISELLDRYPGRTFTLIGDSGEKDPEVYGAIARQYGPRIARILIRRAPGDETTAKRYATAFADLPRHLWQVFDAPAEVA